MNADLVWLLGHVVEVAGEAGTGKTQLALQLSLCASVPRNASQVKNQGVVVYISAEGEGTLCCGF